MSARTTQRARAGICTLALGMLMAATGQLPAAWGAAVGPGTHACNVEDAEGRALLERSGEALGPVLPYQPIYAEDRLKVEEGRVILRCGGERLVLTASGTPFVAPLPAAAPDRLDNIMAWLSGFFGSEESHGEELSSMQVRGGGPIASPLLVGGRFAAGSRSLRIAWQGGREPFSIALLAPGREQPVAVAESSIDRRATLVGDSPLTPGDYRLEIRDVLAQEAAWALEAIDPHEMPTIPGTAGGNGSPDSIDLTLGAAWLASIEEGRFLLEAYQGAAQLAASHRPAALLRDAFEWGRHPPAAPTGHAEATAWIGGGDRLFAYRTPLASSVAGSAAARAALSLVREVGPGGTPGAAAALPETSRGGTNWASVYGAAAPSVAFVALPGGHGSGFVLGSHDWLLTNHHVAENGRLTADRNWQVNVYFGRLSARGLVEPVKVPVPATVYKWDAGLDLALLKLEWGAEPVVEVQPLSLAASGSPLPGQEVAAIGNAGLGLLWSMKPGHVAAIGSISDSHPELLSLVDGEWRASQEGQADDFQGLPSFDELTEDLKASFEEVIGAETLLIQATVPISGGDSGGPLLDTDGDVVGISSWGQGDPRSATSTNYFVHASEIARFVFPEPTAPVLELVRDLWPPWVFEYQLDGLADPADMDILTGSGVFGDLSLVALDLDGAHGLERFADRLAQPDAAMAALERAVAERAFDAEFGLVYDERLGTSYALYDLDNDGRFEVIRVARNVFSPLEDEYHAADDAYRRQASHDGDSLMLPAEGLPTAWQKSYALFLAEIAKLRAE